ncbi:phenylalanine--tRNA ligase alpha subunit-like protein [Leptotrombidium deliense]|uniref:phenylalanine--tRNA ligase n=1 Tax=Leptotrombidium deliense TaxID=299467 RepID=A0A443SIW8_9ACAR|nr:phenylalanine--tRNA ligase alpha subunit-like protein [Leptotrombidium deliense]
MDSSETEILLNFLNTVNQCNSLEMAEALKMNHQKVVGLLKSIQCFGDVIVCEQTSHNNLQLTKEGEGVVEYGSHEARIFSNIPPDAGIEQKLLFSNVGDQQIAKLGFSKAMSLGWITLDKSAEKPLVRRKVEMVEDEVKQALIKIKESEGRNINDTVKQDLKKRKLIQEIKVTSYNVSKGSDFKLKLEKLETELTSEMIAKGTWKEKQFKDYNFDALGVNIERGHLHPLLKVREQFRQIFLEMGFTEMPTNNFVESSFWNFDSLFQPQQHPARDAHDTFFVSDPMYASDPPKEYMEQVKRVHSLGGYGSQGYKYDWDLNESKKNLLRTHTTAVSARMLYALAKQQQSEFKAVKYFSIDRVFRNETLDATHLAEFHQIEGVVANVGITLGDLMGLLSQFFRKLGIHKLKFKPTYNPYTEPSMEIFSYHEGLKKWVEIGNSGMFRPEMLLPMGLPSNVSVIAWGLSLERPTMIKYGIDNIRDLVGHKVDLKMVETNGICLLDGCER